MSNASSYDDGLRCTQQDSPDAFLSLNEAFLYEKEAQNSMVLGILIGYPWHKPGLKQRRFLTVQRGEKPVGYALQTEAKFGLMVSSMTDGEQDVLLDHLMSDNRPIARILGPNATATRCTQLWAQHRGVEYQKEMLQGVLQLHTVNTPELHNGAMRQAVDSQSERALIKRWRTAFVYDVAQNDEDIARGLEVIRKRPMDPARVFFWYNESGKPVSMAAKVRDSRTIGWISLVYTPPEHRGKGYASRLCAMLSQNILDSDKRSCMLHTDLMNPTSNAIYHRIGYKKIGEWVVYTFQGTHSP